MLGLSILRNQIQRIRRAYYTARVKRTVKFVGKGLRVNFKSYVTSNTVLGNNVNFNGMTIRGAGKVVIGDNFHSGTNCLMLTDIHDYDHGDAIPYGSTYISKDITIGDNVWLGSHVIILGGVTIGEGAIIQAGSTVVSDVPDFAICGGHPARVFKYRDIPHYMKLKEEGKFH